MFIFLLWNQHFRIVIMSTAMMDNNASPAKQKLAPAQQMLAPAKQMLTPCEANASTC